MKSDGLIDEDTLTALIKGATEGTAGTDPGPTYEDGKLHIIGHNPDGSPRFVRTAMRYTGIVGEREGEVGISSGYMGNTKNGGKQFFPKSWTRCSDFDTLSKIAEKAEKDFE